MAMSSNMEAPFGVVDMGSNGIRFGIVSALARHLPVAYEERAPISLLEAQGDEHIVPSEIIDEVITSFLRFKKMCEHAGVSLNNVKVIATEATRVASNAQEFLDRIYKATGWTVTLLSKEEEALISASGIVGSFYHVNGLTVDCGGGSFELSYVTRADESATEKIRVCPDPVSLPYGAAALKRRLAQCETSKDRKALYREIVQQVENALNRVNPPDHLSHREGYTLYSSGGGFRALGYLSMAVRERETVKLSKHQRKTLTYPIPIINGYSMTGAELEEIAEYYRSREPEELMRRLRVFRISKRRASMIPASCFLVSAIMKVLKIRRIFFSEGGVRQGLCYQLLPAEVQEQDPLLEGVKAYTAQSQHTLSSDEYDAIYRILVDALPHPYMDLKHPLQLHRLLPAAIHLSNLTSHYPKESRAFVAFHMPLASGPLANLPGLTHYERAVLALLLAFRQGGAVPDPIFGAVQRMVGRKGIAACKYVGRVMELVFAVSPLRPGVGLLKSGLTFKTLPVDISMAMSDDDEESDDECSKDLPEDEKLYPPVDLQIRLPEQDSPMLDAPAVMSVIESLHKKINTNKFDMDDEERRPLHCPQLFSVDIVRQ
ncbi:hypothetical protein DFQ28_001657 [Apophysomyces sp. BC1034]|nr:hypothetical protein DFQ30_002064 [Apophysomyces sp. BC1015]KAG0179894.1 hypothetical protein DFQ29_001510 [Apophysomyces sp. BC1021]KAG0190726.1 hypothetical protein DFQ28_001657 [Apophysomyces sp. BC1034]